jgi:hypothetical protein
MKKKLAGYIARSVKPSCSGCRPLAGFEVSTTGRFSGVHRGWPGHYLKQRAVERKRYALAVGTGRAGRMGIVEILARPHDCEEVLKRVAFG